MPGGDGTGPLGMGGRCTPNIGGGIRGTCGLGRGFGRGRGMGRGFFMNQPTSITREEESKLLEAQASEIKKRLDELRKQ